MIIAVISFALFAASLCLFAQYYIGSKDREDEQRAKERIAYYQGYHDGVNAQKEKQRQEAKE